jgi:MYXO-CTERM domain-containing protein
VERLAPLGQYTSSGSVAGIGGNVDTNVFKGNLDDLLAFVSQGGHGAIVDRISAPSTVLAGEVFPLALTVTNVGGEAWTSSTQLATTEPRDHASLFAHESWLSESRLVGVAGEVGLGESYEFEVQLAAPSEPGTYVESLGLVEDGVAWFGDEAGPDDAAITITVQVVAAPPGAGGGPSNGQGGFAGSPSDGGRGELGDDDGCSVGSSASSTGALPLAVALAGVVARRRRRA